MDYAGEYGRKEDGAEDFQELQDGRDSHSPCAISVEGKQLFISAADEKLEILELQMEGKKRMLAADFLNGMREKIKTEIIFR